MYGVWVYQSKLGAVSPFSVGVKNDAFEQLLYELCTCSVGIAKMGI